MRTGVIEAVRAEAGVSEAGAEAWHPVAAEAVVREVHFARREEVEVEQESVRSLQQAVVEDLGPLCHRTLRRQSPALEADAHRAEKATRSARENAETGVLATAGARGSQAGRLVARPP